MSIVGDVIQLAKLEGADENSNPAPQFATHFQVRHGLGVMSRFYHAVISRDDLNDISSYMQAWKRY
jgi:hypothetical protein